MGILDRVSGTISATGQKTKDFADIAKLNSKISDNNNRINQLYMEIGEIYYNTYRANPDRKMAQHIETITRMKAQIEEWNDQIQGLRGMVKCPECGNYVASNVLYCTVCGKRIQPETADLCPHCHAIVEKGAMFCPKCGFRLTGSQPQVAHKKVICVNCGTELDEESMFCPNCGTSRSVSEASQSAAGASAQQNATGPAPEAETVQQEQPTPETAKSPEKDMKETQDTAENAENSEESAVSEPGNVQDSAPEAGTVETAEQEVSGNASEAQESEMPEDTDEIHVPENTGEEEDKQKDDDNAPEEDDNSGTGTGTGKTCPVCGSVQDADTMFCMNCGAKLE